MIIDFHTHGFPEKIASRAISSLEKTAGISANGDGTFSAIENALKECGVTYGCVLNIAMTPTQEAKVNETALANDCFINQKGSLIHFGSVHPFSETAILSLDRLKNEGIKGLKLHPDYQGFFINDKTVYPIYEKISSLELPVVFHSGYDPYSPSVTHAPAAFSKEMLENFPKMKVVLAHLGSMFNYEDSLEKLAGKFENLYFDIAFSDKYVKTDLLMRFINKHGHDRILFASDFPWNKPSLEIELVMSLPISDDKKEDIFKNNAIDLLGIQKLVK